MREVRSYSLVLTRRKKLGPPGINRVGAQNPAVAMERPAVVTAGLIVVTGDRAPVAATDH